MPQDKLIEHAGEIAAANKVHLLLAGAITEADAEFLVKLKNPLELVSDLYISDQENNGPFFYEVCEHLLVEIDRDDYEVESDLAIEEAEGITMQ